MNGRCLTLAPKDGRKKHEECAHGRVQETFSAAMDGRFVILAPADGRRKSISGRRAASTELLQ